MRVGGFAARPIRNGLACVSAIMSPCASARIRSPVRRFTLLAASCQAESCHIDKKHGGGENSHRLYTGKGVSDMGKHKSGKVFFGVWMEESIKKMVAEDAKHAQLPNWSLSDQLRYEILERRGLWKEPYSPSRPSREQSRKQVA